MGRILDEFKPLIRKVADSSPARIEELDKNAPILANFADNLLKYVIL
jgi:hypothetical protein